MEADNIDLAMDGGEATNDGSDSDNSGKSIVIIKEIEVQPRPSLSIPIPYVPSYDSSQESDSEPEYEHDDYKTSFEFKDWHILSEDPNLRMRFGLNPDRENNDFTNQCRLLVVRISDHVFSGGCMSLSVRALNRYPTVDEFWFNYLNKNMPRVSWYADLKFVDDESRGWPLKYTLKAKVLVRKMDFPTPFGRPVLDAEIVESFDDKFNVGCVVNCNLWRLEPTGPANGFLTEGVSIEDGRRAQSIVRWFYDNVHFDFDNEDFQVFVRDFLRNRLEVLSHLEWSGPLSPSMRGKIIQGIKVYHHLQQEIYLHENEKEEMMDEDMKEENPNKQGIYLRLSGLLEQHTKSMEYLFYTPFHPIVNMLDMGRCEVGDVCNYSYVLVTKSVTINDLKTIHQQIEEYQKTVNHNISDMKTVNNLNEALRLCNPGTTIFLASGNYNITGLGNLEEGGNLIGIRISNRDVTISPTDEIGDIWINTIAERYGPLIIKNITFVVDAWSDRRMETCIFVSRGKTVLEGCVIRRIGFEQGEGDKNRIPAGKMYPIQGNQHAVFVRKNVDIFNFSGDHAHGNDGGDQGNVNGKGEENVDDGNAEGDGIAEVNDNGGGNGVAAEVIQPSSARSRSRSPLK